MRSQDGRPPLKIAHFSDIHITAPSSEIALRNLLSKRVLGWINLTLLRRGHHFADGERILGAFIEDIDQVRPDHVVSTGDLTALSLPGEFETARRLLAPLLDRPQVTGIPGNHDVYVRSAARLKLYEKAFGSWTRTDLGPEDFPPEFRHLHPYPLVRFFGEDVVLLALRDARPNLFHDSTGRVGAPQRRLLEHILRDPRLSRRVKVLAAHCGYWRAGGRPDRIYHRLRDGRALLEIAREGGVSLVIHGHTHQRFVMPRGKESPVHLANPGSLTASCQDRSYHLYTISDGGIEVSVRRFDSQAGRFVPWPDAPGAQVLEL